MAAAALLIAALIYSALKPPAPIQPPAQPQEPVVETAPATDKRPADALRREVPQARPSTAGQTLSVRDEQMTLTATLPSPREESPRLKLSGSASFPDGTQLQLTVMKWAEQLSGGRLVPVLERIATQQPVVEKGRFAASTDWRGAGRYELRIALGADQRADVAAELKKIPARVSVLALAAWGDDLVTRLAPALLTVEDLSKRALEIVQRIEKLASQESTWIAERKNEDVRGADVVLTREAKALMKELFDVSVRLDAADASGLHPAALQELRLTIQKLSGNAAYFVYEKGTGKFAGVRNYHAPEKPVETQRGEPFTFDVIQRYLAEAPLVAGRETALWLVQDLRRTTAPTEPWAAALKLLGDRPGIASVSARLQKPDVAQLEAIEAEVRSGRS